MWGFDANSAPFAPDVVLVSVLFEHLYVVKFVMAFLGVGYIREIEHNVIRFDYRTISETSFRY